MNCYIFCQILDEEDSIRTIQGTAKECKELLIQTATEHVNQMTINK